MKAKIYWEPQERAAVVDCIVQKIRSHQVQVNFHSKRMYGLTALVATAQNEVLSSGRRRPPVSVLVTEIGRLVRERIQEIESDPGPIPETVSQPEQPAIPSRLGMNPKFAEAVAFVCQEMVRAFAETFGEAIGRNVRDAIYDVRHHLGTPPSYVGREPVTPKSEQPRDFGNLPERLRNPKAMILGLLPQQQQTIARTFPNLDFRFMGKGTPSKHIAQVAQGCTRVFLMTKFTPHSDGTCVPSEKLRRVNGGMTDLTIAIQRQFPETPYVPARGEKLAV